MSKSRFYIVLVCFACLLLVGCKSKIKYIESVRNVPVMLTDTLWRTQALHDSVTVHDSIYIHQRGDTVFKERWRTQTKWRDRTDTLWRIKEKPVVMIDSIPYPIEMEKEVIKYEQHWWQKMLSIIGGITGAGGLAWIVWRIKK